jgi:diaminohydroxyphosphoribosylaminopyrimidine deaminase/5-amino-6-(5-phosphoribosylamino)uracil reductase
VGAVLVKDGKRIGRGYHKAAGRPHAEVEALREAGDRSPGATLYVTLEPCCHHGRTPPCVDAILKAGIRRVVAAIPDVNPLVAGKGIEKLRAAGVEVEVGCCAHEATHINQPFLTYHRLKRPFFVAKWALTLDGQFRATSGDSQWITNEKSRHYVHELRARYDAVMAGIGTVLFDNPRLNARLPDRTDVIQPLRIVVDSHLRTPVKANCLAMEDAGRTIIATTALAPRERIQRLEQLGVTVVVVPGNRGLIDLRVLAEVLHEMEIQSVFVEGGRKIHSALFTADLADYVVAFFAPKVVGRDEERYVLSGWGKPKMKDALPLRDVKITQFDNDVCVEGYVRRLETNAER